MRSVVALLLLLLLAAVSASVSAAAVDYSAHRLFRVDLTHAHEPQLLAARLAERFDVWGRSPRRDAFELDVFGTDEVIAFARSLGLTPHAVDTNVQAQIERERARLAAYNNNNNKGNNGNDWFLDYHRWNESIAWYRDMATTYARLVTFVPSVGKTWEGRDLVAVRVTSPAGGSSKRQVWIQANIHAREWITSAAIQFFFNETVARYGQDARATALLDSAEIIIIPYVNPDGFDYTWTNDRLWRKNRRDNGDGSKGVDLNRNQAEENWGGVGSSGIPASDTYRGPSAASEPETRALNAYLLAQPRIVAAADIHSYGQLILRPYAFTNQNPPFDAQVKVLGDAIRDEIFTVHQKRYTSDNWYDGLYASSGTSQDYFMEQNFGGFRPYGFTIELRPTEDRIGFELPPDEIIPTGEELTAGLWHFIEYSVANPIVFV